MAHVRITIAIKTIKCMYLCTLYKARTKNTICYFSYHFKLSKESCCGVVNHEEDGSSQCVIIAGSIDTNDEDMLYDLWVMVTRKTF